MLINQTVENSLGGMALLSRRLQVGQSIASMTPFNLRAGRSAAANA
ncbi:hypothetical protein [Arthrobacter sp. U41]|nr:hypothetical protein [Arthrobacter sp. U41]